MSRTPIYTFITTGLIVGIIIPVMAEFATILDKELGPIRGDPL